jgi:hypothetical protein
LLSVNKRASRDTEVAIPFGLICQFASSPDAVDKYVLAVASFLGRDLEPADLVSMLAINPNLGSIKCRFLSCWISKPQFPQFVGKETSGTSLKGARLWKNQPQESQVIEIHLKDPKSI